MKHRIKLSAIALIMLSSCGNTENASEKSVAKIVEPQKEVIKNYDYYLKRIVNDKEWMLSVEEQAQEKGISVDSSLVLNARHMARQNGFLEEEDQEIRKDYNYYLKRIKEDRDWMIGVKAQAKEKGITVDSSLVLNARHMAKTWQNSK